MASEVIPDRTTAFGERVHRRLTAEILDGFPSVADDPAWLEKYGEAIDARFGSAATFAERFPVPVRVRLTRVRGS